MIAWQVRPISFLCGFGLLIGHAYTTIRDHLPSAVGFGGVCAKLICPLAYVMSEVYSCQVVVLDGSTVAIDINVRNLKFTATP